MDDHNGAILPHDADQKPKNNANDKGQNIPRNNVQTR